MVYTECLVFPPFCGGCLKCSLLGPKWDVGGEMITGGKRSSVNPWQKACRSTEPFTVCPPWWQLLAGGSPSGCQQGWPGAAGSTPRPGEVAAEEGYWAEVGVPRAPPGCWNTALISLGKSPQTTDTHPRGTGWTPLTFVPLVIICEPSNALGLFCKNLLVKPLSSRALILLG